MGRRQAITGGLAAVTLTVALGTAACGGNTALAPTAQHTTTHGTGTGGNGSNGNGTGSGNANGNGNGNGSSGNGSGSGGTGNGSGATGSATGSGNGSGNGSTSTGAATATGPTTASTTSATSAAAAVRACGNDDLKISWGYGTQSQPLQAAAVVFKNISTHTCTLQGYPGAAIKDGGTTIDASRVLNGFRGSLPPLSRPPLVTLAPGGVSYAVLEWMLHTNQSCYPTGAGAFEITAPNTTKTVTFSASARMGLPGICSAFVTNPVVPGTFGVSVGN